jgi:AraC-like DNA-binding protein
MLDRFRLSSMLPRKLEELGLVPADVLRLAGLSPGLFQAERIQVTTEELFAFYRGLAQAGDPAIGLKLGTENRLERYSALALAAVSSRSLRDSLERLARYKQLTCPEAIEVSARGEEGRVRFKWLLAQETEPPVLIDVCFAAVVSTASRGTNGAITPKRIELRREATHAEMYAAHFGCPVAFHARHNAIVFKKEDLDRPFLTHNADLLAAVAPQLEAELERAVRSPATLGDQVKVTLKRLLAGRRPGLDDVARELGTSTRTLQRRLTEAGVTFQHLLQDARRELARHYLRHSSLELNETAYLLGYEDNHSFFRAFQQWEGTSPGEWRARHGAPAPAVEAGVRGRA